MRTASGLDRLMTCPTSDVLQHVYTEDTEYTTEGNVFHDFRQRSREVGRAAALAELDDETRAVCERLPDMSAYKDFAAEVAFAYDPGTGQARELARGKSRDEAYKLARPGEICGTVDAVGVTADGTVHTLEEKFGHQARPELYEWQVKFAALAACRAWGHERAISDLACQRPDREPDIVRTDYGPLELSFIAADLATLTKRLDAAKSTDPVTQSKHCRYCPAAFTCPANVSTLALLAETGPDVRITATRAGEAYHFIQAAENVIGIMKKQLRQIAQVEPVPIGDGRYYGPVQSPGRRAIDGDAAYQALVALRGHEFASAAAEHKVTQAGIARALAAEKAAGRLDKVEPEKKALLSQLEGSGCITRNPKTVCKEYGAQPCRTDGCGWQAMSPGGTCRMCAVEVGQ